MTNVIVVIGAGRIGHQAGTPPMVFGVKAEFIPPGAAAGIRAFHV